MPKVIDLELDLPPTVDEMVDRMEEFLLHSDEKGLANYGNIFGPSRARALAVSYTHLTLPTTPYV